MTRFLSWITSFFAMISLWIFRGFVWFTREGMDFSQVESEHRTRLCNSIQSLEKCLKDLRASSTINMLNKNQCVHLYDKLLLAMKNIDQMLSIATNDLKFQRVLEELFVIQEKVKMVGRNCIEQEQWFHSIAFQFQNKETFRELLLDLKCCYDMALDLFLLDHPSASNDIVCITFDASTLQQVQEDGNVFKRKLEFLLQDLWSEGCEIAQHFLLRLRNLDRVDGGDLDTLDIPKDFKIPNFIHQLGKGASGEVFKSNWLSLLCATKIMKGDLEYLMSCRKEVGILAGLNHPNLVQFLGCGINEKVVGEPEMYLVMEMMESSLSTILRQAKGPLPYYVAIDIMHQIAKGVYYLHDMQVAHLDLKPDNILASSACMDPCPIFKVSDYGTSLLEVPNNHANPKPSKRTVGTREYKAPEVVKGSRSPLYPFQADVWSFAMTCCEILSRKVPYSDLTHKELCSWYTTNPNLRPSLPNNCVELTNLIEECWSLDPLQRPTFSTICARLTKLKKSFVVGMYSWNMVPKFDFPWASRESILHLVPKLVEQSPPQIEVLVGLEDTLFKATRLLKMKYVGIVGMGGIGKTTLAKAICDHAFIGSNFDALCFVDQSKNYPSSYAILCEILPKLRGDDKKPKNIGDAKKMMEQLFMAKRILLVLDDVDDEVMVNEIVPHSLVQASKGSTILLTTRKWSAIQSLVDIEGRLDMDFLDEETSTTLFNSHLDKDGASLSLDFEDLRKRVVKACNGLPLSLKVMGKFLRGKERLRCWERALQRMARGKDLGGDKSIWKTLQVSFDGLNNDVEKGIFLDVACFFCRDVYSSGISKETILMIWSKEGILPVRELERLIDMSLMKVSKDGEFLAMHDQLRDMGRRLSKGTRIWKASMIPEGGFSSSDAKGVEGISWLGSSNPELLMVQLDATLPFKNLRILFLRSMWDNPAINFDNLILFFQFASQCCGLETLLMENPAHRNLIPISSPNSAILLNDLVFGLCSSCSSLKILDLVGLPFLEQLPQKFASRNILMRLNLSKSHTLKTVQGIVGNLPSLTTLNLRGCLSLVTLPSEVGNLSFLKTLKLGGCSSLVAVPPEVGNLSSLTTLDLGGCSSLVELPIDMGNLSSLSTLGLSWCSKLTSLPIEVGKLSSLTTLDLGGCSSLVALPIEVGNMYSLTILNMRECSSLMALPVEVGNLSSLTTLNLKGCLSLVALPSEVGNLSSLTTLNLRGCSSLKALPSEVGNLLSLTTLDLSGCSSLEALPAKIGNLSSLTTLNLWRCTSLKVLPIEVGKLSFLNTLSLCECSSLVALPFEVSNLFFLTSLDLRGCSSLVALSVELAKLPSLTTLDLKGCSSLKVLPSGLNKLSSLTTLNLKGCLSMVTLPIEVSNLSFLTTLDLEGCSSLLTLPSEVGNLSFLTTLKLRGCSSLAVLPVEVGNLSSLTNLNLGGCSSLVALPIEVGNLSSLKILKLWGCASLELLPAKVGNLSSLTTLNMGGCSTMVALPIEVGNLSFLKTLTLRGCMRLASLPIEVGNLSSLTTLNLGGCLSLKALPSEVGNLSSLITLDLGGCSCLEALPSKIVNLSFLRTLDIEGCSSLGTLPIEVGNLSSLTSLKLRGCSCLVALPAEVGNLYSLKTLKLGRCLLLEALPIQVGYLSSLETLDLKGCLSLVALPVEVGNLSSLKTLDLEGCSSLKAWPLELGSLLSLSTLNLKGS